MRIPLPDSVLSARLRQRLRTLAVGCPTDNVLGAKRWIAAFDAGEWPTDAEWPLVRPVRARFLAELGIDGLASCRRSLTRSEELVLALVERFRVELHSTSGDSGPSLENEAAEAELAQPAEAESTEHARGSAKEGHEGAQPPRAQEPEAQDECRQRQHAELWSDYTCRATFRSLSEQKDPLVNQLRKLQAIVSGSTEISELLDALGRGSTFGIRDRVGEPSGERAGTQGIGRAPSEARGIERSAELARMLPCEALALCTSPSEVGAAARARRLLWHARRAEAALLCYRFDGPQELPPKPRRARRGGPMIVVVDCSLSMAGGRELLAKAIVLEAAVRAQRQARRCFLLSYGGAEELTTLEVDACTDPGTLFDFALRTFHGHTDTSDVLRVVLNRVLGNFGDGVDVWRQADVLWLSDGEWSMREGLLSDLAKAKERGTRFVGCLIGAAEAGGMEALCDELHRLGLETLRRSQVQAAEHRRA